MIEDGDYLRMARLDYALEHDGECAVVIDPESRPVRGLLSGNRGAWVSALVWVSDDRIEREGWD